MRKLMWSSHLPQVNSPRGGQPLQDNHSPRKMSHIFKNKLCNKVNKHLKLPKLEPEINLILTEYIPIQCRFCSKNKYFRAFPQINILPLSHALQASKLDNILELFLVYAAIYSLSVQYSFAQQYGKKLIQYHTTTNIVHCENIS